jgi:hypothetical protein
VSMTRDEAWAFDTATCVYCDDTIKTLSLVAHCPDCEECYHEGCFEHGETRLCEFCNERRCEPCHEEHLEECRAKAYA